MGSAYRPIGDLISNSNVTADTLASGGRRVASRWSHFGVTLTGIFDSLARTRQRRRIGTHSYRKISKERHIATHPMISRPSPKIPGTAPSLMECNNPRNNRQPNRNKTPVTSAIGHLGTANGVAAFGVFRDMQNSGEWLQRGQARQREVIDPLADR